jgi:tRNA(Ile)-lysidine synthase
VCDDSALNVERWRTLSPARQANALREWLRRATGRGAPESLIARLCTELAPGTTAQWPLFNGVELRLWRDRLQLQAPDSASLPSVPVTLDIRRAGTYRVPGWEGALRVTRVRHGGVALERLHRCELRPRIGAERFQAGPNRPSRSLKKQFQAAGIAPWAREAPLLYGDDMLLFVPGLGIDARALAAPGEPQVAFDWIAG